MSKKIVLIGPYYFRNFGDPLYMETAKATIQKLCSVEVEIVDFYERTSFDEPKDAKIKQSFFF